MKREMLMAAMAATVVCGAAERDVTLAGEGWRFAKDATFELRAEGVGFDDTAWESVRVPHDWAISGPFDESKTGWSGKLPWQGVGWYRRTFTLDPADAGSRVFLDFDGVMARPQVYVNGHLAGGCNYGYASFRVDATPFVKFNGPNTLAVRADTRFHHARWYPGAGIYRKVVMHVRNAAHFAYNSVFVQTPRVANDEADVKVTWEAVDAPKGARVEVEVEGVRESARAEAGGTVLTVRNPRRWDVDAPNLYTANVRLRAADGAVLSQENVRFGIRTIAFPVPTEGPAVTNRAANGFHLNGRRVQLNGVDLHSDLGLLGMAFDKSAMRRQLQLMKDMGANALRTSHNCPAPEVLDLCDEMGIVVWDECFDSWGALIGRLPEESLERFVGDNLQAFVRRDRNHPCVIVWSMYNEIGKGDPKDPKNPGLTKERCSFLRSLVRLHDTTRPVGGGNIGYMSRPDALDMRIYDDFDITGWNYGGSYRPVKAMYPNKPIIYSESASAVSSYGFYPERLPQHKHDFAKDVFQTDGYDFNAMPDIADAEFERMEKDVYVCGEFVWTGIDYLGEPTPYGNEARSSYFGIVDLMGVPKDRYWLYRSHWNRKVDTLHIVPHWTWPGREGKPVPVFVYTSGDSAELFLNGKSLGVRRKGVLEERVNFAKGGRVTVSSQEVQNPAEGLLDGDGKTRWCACNSAFPAWAQIDLPKAVTFRAAQIDFEQNYESYGFRLETSDDGTTWRTIFEKRKNEGKRPVFDQPQSSQHLRVTVTESTGGWASIREFALCNDPVERPSAYYDVCAKYRLMWYGVPYEPGELKVVAYKNGQKLGEKAVRTAGKPAALAATVEPKRTGDADELLWVQIDALDAQGVRNPVAMDRVSFKLEGPGKILGVGNGNAYEFEAFTKTDSHPLFYGKAMAVVRRDAPGELKLTVSAPNLKSSSVILP